MFTNPFERVECVLLKIPRDPLIIQEVLPYFVNLKFVSEVVV